MIVCQAHNYTFNDNQGIMVENNISQRLCVSQNIFTSSSVSYEQ